MKKIALVLSMLLVIGMAGVFAEASVGGEFQIGLTSLGTADATSNLVDAEVNIKATVDDYTSVAVELDSEGGDWDTRNVSFDDFRVTSDITGALGLDLPVAVSVTAGYFDKWYNNWNIASRTGLERSAVAASGIFTTGPRATFAVDTTVTIMGKVNVNYWQPFDGSSVSFAVGSRALIPGGNFIVGYHADTDAFGDGTMWLNAGYGFAAGPANLTVPVMVAYALGAEAFGWNSGVVADMDFVKVAVGVAGGGFGPDVSMFHTLNAEVSTAIVENADIFAIGYFDFDATDVFQSVDLGVGYSFGAFSVVAGGVIASGDAVATGVWGDDMTQTGSGVYLGMAVNY